MCVTMCVTMCDNVATISLFRKLLHRPGWWSRGPQPGRLLPGRDGLPGRVKQLSKTGILHPIRYTYLISCIPKNQQVWPLACTARAQQTFNFLKITGNLQIPSFYFAKKKIRNTFFVHFWGPTWAKRFFDLGH